jgi:putative inorganic carbon (HCO3(-)) transporter
MRDLLFAAIFGVWTLFAIRRTWVAVLLWTWISVMNPHKLCFGFANDAPVAVAAAAVVGLSILFGKQRLQLRPTAPVVVLVTLIVWMCITTIFALDSKSAIDQLMKVLKIQLMTVVALAALQERRSIELFVWINAMSVAFYGVKGGIFTILGGGAQRVYGPPGGFFWGNNELGLALVTVIPLVYYLRLQSKNRVVRHGLLATMLLSATAALGTQSRGAFLALAAMGIVLWLRAPRKLLVGVITASVAVMLLTFMPATWDARMNTIQNYEEDTSAMGRINAWRFAINLARDRPLVGGGFEVTSQANFDKWAPNPQDLHAAHSIYFQMLGEHGYPGLILYVLLGIIAFRKANQIRKLTRGKEADRWLYDLAGMCQVSLVGFAVGGAFLSLAYFDLPFNIMVMIVTSYTYLRGRDPAMASATGGADAYGRRSTGAAQGFVKRSL